MTIALFILAVLVLIALFLNHELRREKQAAQKAADHWRSEYSLARQGWHKADDHLRATQKRLRDEQENNVRYLERLGATQAKLDDTQQKLTATTSQLADANLRLEGATACLTGPLSAPNGDDTTDIGDDDMPF